MKKIFALVLLSLMLSGAACADMKINITANGQVLSATLDENPVSRELYERLPLYLNMKNLYGREMSCVLPYRVPEVRTTATNYSIGDIIYMPHRRSLAILYSQNGERFRRIHLGHIDAGAEMFATTGDMEVIFTVAVDEQDL